MTPRIRAAGDVAADWAIATGASGLVTGAALYLVPELVAPHRWAAGTGFVAVFLVTAILLEGNGNLFVGLRRLLATCRRDCQWLRRLLFTEPQRKGG